MELLKCSKNFITQFSQHMERKVHFLSVCVCVSVRERVCVLLQSWPMLTSKKSSFSFPSNNWVFYLRNTQYTHQFESLTRCLFLLFFDEHFFRFWVFFILFCLWLFEIKSESKRKIIIICLYGSKKNHSNQTPPVCRFGFARFDLIKIRARSLLWKLGTLPSWSWCWWFRRSHIITVNKNWNKTLFFALFYRVVYRQQKRE